MLEEQRAFNYKMRKAPSYVMNFYNGKLKNLKGSKSGEKLTCMREVIGEEGFESQYFKNLLTLKYKDLVKCGLMMMLMMMRVLGTTGQDLHH